MIESRGPGYVVVRLSAVQEACYQDPGMAGRDYRAFLGKMAPLPCAMVVVGNDGLIGARTGFLPRRGRYGVA